MASPTGSSPPASPGAAPTAGAREPTGDGGLGAPAHAGDEPATGDTDRAAARDARRADLLRAAKATISRDGPAASMEAIAREAGITKPILYRHFGDREGLVRALAEQFADRLVTVLRAQLETADRDPQVPPRQMLHDTIDAYIAFIEADPELYMFLIQHTPETAATVSGAADRVALAVAWILGDGLHRRGADDAAAEPWAYGIIGLVHLAGEHWVHRPAMPREDLVTHLTTLLWSGLSDALAPADVR